MYSLKLERRMHDEGLLRKLVDESYTKTYRSSDPMILFLKFANTEVATTKRR